MEAAEAPCLGGGCAGAPAPAARTACSRARLGVEGARGPETLGRAHLDLLNSAGGGGPALCSTTRFIGRTCLAVTGRLAHGSCVPGRCACARQEKNEKTLLVASASWPRRRLGLPRDGAIVSKKTGRRSVGRLRTIRARAARARSPSKSRLPAHPFYLTLFSLPIAIHALGAANTVMRGPVTIVSAFTIAFASDEIRPPRVAAPLRSSGSYRADEDAQVFSIDLVRVGGSSPQSSR